MGNFQPGHLVPVSWQVSAAGAPYELNVKETSLDMSVMLHDVTGVKAQGVRARLAGPLDVASRLLCDLDLDEAPWFNGVGVVPGFRGILRYGVSVLGHRIQIPMQCEKLHFSGSTDKEMMWDADWKVNSLVGLVVFPAL